ncbi:MAG: hypothetical protein F6J87_28970 [Spirulina sp. SIO3F2]|nr:hypothetical protein [Spirulina sp. SIO3F2]
MSTSDFIVECPECHQHLVVQEAPLIRHCVKCDSDQESSQKHDTDFSGLGMVLSCIGTVIFFVCIL